MSAPVAGDATALALPATPQDLIALGPDWLTDAFRAFGSLDEDNAVTAIAASADCHAGNSGDKLRLTLDYARPGPERDLFVKFSRCPADPFRDRRRMELEAEVRLAQLSRHPAFPVAVAPAWFADFHHESGTGLLISSTIRFGEDGILPERIKCHDHELPDVLDHYRATLSALARLAGAYRAGTLSPLAERLFPYDQAQAQADIPITLDAGALGEKIAALRAFIAAAPQLFPPRVSDPRFLARMEGDALRFLSREMEIRRFLQADAAYVALAHWNTNLDNAWFWRDAAGALHCGLLDWGMVRVMNVAWGIWGGLSVAEPAFWDAEGDGLLTHFASEYRAHGGPAINFERLALHLDLSLIILGLGLMMDLPALVASRMPEAIKATSLRDPMLEADKVVQGFCHCTANFLNLWARRDFAASLNKALG